MKKALLISILHQVIATTSLAQPASLDWVLPFDQPFTVASKELVALPNGNTLWIGNYLNAVDLDLGLGGPALSTPARGSYFAELTTTGAVVGAFGLDCSGFIYSHAVINPATGGKILFGYFQGTMDMDPSTSVVNSTTSAGEYDAFVIALDAADNFEWGHRIGATGFDEVSIATVDAAGNIYLSGRYTGTVDFDPGPEEHSLNDTSGSESRFVLKFNVNGTYQWARRLYTTDNIMLVTSLVAHPNGDLYLTGAFSGTIDLDPGNDAHNVSAEGADADAFLLRWTGAGEFVWAHVMSAAGPQVSYGTHSSDGSIILSLNLSQSVDLDPGTGVVLATSAGDYDACIAQFNEDGDLGWWHAWGGPGVDVITSLHVDPFGQIHALTGFTGEVDHDPTAGVLLFDSGTEGNISLSTFSADGAFHGALHLGPGAACSCQVDGLAALNDGSLMFAGSMQGSCDMDPSEGVTVLQDLGFMRRYIMRILQAPGTGLASVTERGALDVFPNPAHDLLRVRTDQRASAPAVLVDITGKTVAQVVLSGPETVVDVRGLKPGLYVLRAMGGSTRFVVQ